MEVQGTTTYFRYATNVSVGGMFLEGTVPYEVGSRVTLIFIAPGDSQPTRVEAEVVGGGEGDVRGMRLRFLDDEDSDLRIRLRAYVRQRTQSDVPDEAAE